VVIIITLARILVSVTEYICMETVSALTCYAFCYLKLPIYTLALFDELMAHF